MKLGELFLIQAMHYLFSAFRSSPPEVFLGKGFLKIWSKFAGENPCKRMISIKKLCNFIEITLRHGYSPVNLLHIFRTPFLKNTSGGLLLNRDNFGSNENNCSDFLAVLNILAQTNNDLQNHLTSPVANATYHQKFNIKLLNYWYDILQADMINKIKEAKFSNILADKVESHKLASNLH